MKDAEQHGRLASPLYQRIPLDPQSDEIRLIEISTANDDTDVLYCWFHKLSLAQQPSYTALSYAWGDPGDEKAIYVGGHRVFVRGNLHSFLVQARKRNMSRL